jgi:hypothetical protein
MDKNTKNLLTAGAVIVGGIILLKGAKEFIGEETPSGSFGGSGSGEEDRGFPIGDTKYPEIEYDYPIKQPFITPLQDPTIQKSLDSVNKSTQTSPQYAPLGSTPTSTFGILGELPISLLANTWSFTGDKVGSGGGVYYPATKTYIDSSGQGYSVSQAPMGAYVNNQGLYDAKSQTFTDVFGQKTSMTKEDASNRQLNIKQTSSTPLQTPDTSKLSETNFGLDVVSNVTNPLTYLGYGSVDVAMFGYEYITEKQTGKNILERNYTAEELEKMSAFEKSIKQEYSKYGEVFKTTGSAIKGTAVKVGASQLSTASKVVSYAKNTTSNVVNAVKTSVGSTKSSSSSSKSSSGSSGKSSGSSSSSKSSSASSVNIWNSAVKQASSSNASSSSKSSSASSVNIWNSAVKQAQTSSSSSKSSSNVINKAISNLAKKSSSSKSTKK